MSEIRNGNDGRKSDDRSGSRQNNRWHRKSKLIDRWVDGRMIFKEQELDVRGKMSLFAERTATGRKVVSNCDKEEDNLQDTTHSGSSEVNMETRKRARVKEDTTIMQRRAREIKGIEDECT